MSVADRSAGAAHAARVPLVAVLAAGLALMGGIAPAFAEPTGSITGTVTDAANTPIEGVSVYIDGTDASDTSGDDGTYELTGLESGDYVVQVTDPNAEWRDASTGAIEVLDGAEISDVDFVLTARGNNVLYGTVTDETGEPVEGVEVYVEQGRG